MKLGLRIPLSVPSSDLPEGPRSGAAPRGPALGCQKPRLGEHKPTEGTRAEASVQGVAGAVGL